MPERNPRNANTRRAALANEIAQAIRLRMFRPGEWLRQIDLEQRFQATRFDVRAALDELSVRKTIEHVPNRGYRVAAIDMRTYEQIQATRQILEPATAPGIVAEMDSAAVTRLAELAQRFSTSVSGGSRAEQSEINRAFHQLMYSFCGNAVVEELIWGLRDRSRGSQITVWVSHDALLQSDREHHEMVEAIRAHDPGRLAQLIGHHITKVGAAEPAYSPTVTSQARGSELTVET